MARTGETTPLTNIRQAIANAIDAAVLELHTSIPGIVISYDSATQLATVQIAIRRKDADDNVYEIPPIQRVPVLFPRSSAGSVHLPLAKGDSVLLVFSERALDRWRQAGDVVDPGNIARFHHFTDAFAIPGAAPDSSPLVFDSAADREGVCVQTPDAKVVIDSAGLVRIGKRGATPGEPVVLGTVLTNYLGAIHSALDAVLQALITGPVGVGNLGNPVPTDPTLAVTLTTQKTALSTAKTTYVDTATTNVVSQRTFVDRGT